jgi:hypothetical protein
MAPCNHGQFQSQWFLGAKLLRCANASAAELKRPATGAVGASAIDPQQPCCGTAMSVAAEDAAPSEPG